MNTKKTHYCVGGETYISPSCEIVTLRAEQLICQSGDAPDSAFEDMLDTVDIPWIL